MSGLLIMALIGFNGGWLLCAAYTVARRRGPMTQRDYERVRHELERCGWAAKDARLGATAWWNVCRARNWK